MTLTVPGFGTLARSLYPMYISDAAGKEIILCDILELNHTESYEIPHSPVDKNSMISDNIYKSPETLNARVFVTANDFNDFEGQIQRIQKDSGFNIKGLDRFYTNMRITNRETSETAEIGSGYIIEINFREVITVAAKRSVMTETSADPSNATPVNLGNKTPQETVLKSIAGGLLG